MVADASGNVTGTFTVPSSVDLGAHTVTLSGAVPGYADPQSLSASITVIAATVTPTSDEPPVAPEMTPTNLPVTGTDVVATGAAALVLLAGGGALVAVTRRRMKR